MHSFNLFKIKFILVILSLSISVFAKEKSVSLVTNIDGKNHFLKIDKMDVTVKILGNIAETTLDIAFKNDLNKQIEGTFYLPLKENASVFEYQFEMNDSQGKKVMKKGVVVEKQKARVAYEETVRTKVDPGLLIWTKGNNFKTRIYPLNPNSTKRIIVSYQEDLTRNTNKICAGKCPSYYYNLPLNIKYKLSKFSMKINSNGIHVYSVSKEKNRFILDKSKNLVLIDENYIPNENIKIAVFSRANTKLLAPKKNAIINFSKIKSKDNSYYFTATVFPTQSFKDKKKPKRICVYWDSSRSMKDRDIQKELDFLSEYTKLLAKPSISLINFSNTQKVLGRFNSKKGEIPKRMLKKLKNTIYDGGSQLGVINTKKTNCQEALVFTDGISNFGSNKPNLTIPTYFINSKLTAEHSYMKHLANISAGNYINLQNTDLKKAIKIINSQKLRFISTSKDARLSISRSISRSNSNKIKELWPSSPTEVQDSFTIAGITNAKDQNITLNFGTSNKITQTITLSLSINGACTGRPDHRSVYTEPVEVCLPNPMIERKYARIKIASLVKTLGRASQRVSQQEEIIKTSKKYSILTEFTSFLVLETLEDYLKYKIIPPKDMQKEYFEILEKQELTQKESKQKQIEKVLKKYKEFEAWWTKEHRTVAQIKTARRKAIIAKKKAIKARKIAEEAEEKAQEAEERRRIIENYDVGDYEMEGKIAYGSGGISGGGYGSSSKLAKRGRGRMMRGKAIVSKNKSVSGFIELKSFDPNTPYLKELKKAKKGHYKLYLKLRKNYEKSSSFYLDVSDFFMKKRNKKLALKILSNIAELELENHELLRILGYRLWQLKKYKLAEYTFLEVLKMRPEEPQSYRDLALTYRSMKKYKKAIKLLYKVATTAWDSRFSDIDLISLYEMNAIVGANPSISPSIALDKRLIKNLAVDIRVVLSWDTNSTDIDLWVTDPVGKKCFYDKKRTVIGGYMTNDFTGGYGPEMFTLRNAGKGKYKIQANYYGSSNQSLSGEVTLYVELFLNYGKKNQTRKEIVLRVKNEKQVIDIAEFEIK